MNECNSFNVELNLSVPVHVYLVLDNSESRS